MANWIERYVYDVVRRLPEKDREDVRRELESNIYDMLPDSASEEEIREVLNSLGPPAELAEKYRQNPRYLISPACYDDYVRTLKWLLPLIGCILLAVGMALGAVNGIRDGITNLSTFIGKVVSNGISFGVEGAIQALLWATVGFVIADRTKAKKASAAGSWTVNDLPEDMPSLSGKGKIPLSDSIVELVVVVVFSFVVILMCLGVIPAIFIVQSGGVVVRTLFSSSFLAALIPVIIVSSLFTVAECVAKIVHRRWTPAVCAAVVVSNLVGIGLMLFLFLRHDVFSPEFSAFVQSQPWSQWEAFRFMGSGVGIEYFPVFIVAIIVIVISLIECSVAVYRTVRAARNAQPGAV